MTSVVGEAMGRVQGDRVIVTEGAAVAGEGVLVEPAGCGVLTQLAQGVGEVGGRVQGVGVVLAQHPAKAGKGVLVKLAGCGVLTQHVQVDGEVGGRDQGVGRRPRRTAVRA